LGNPRTLVLGLDRPELKLQVGDNLKIVGKMPIPYWA
jgi:hypothetical protein